MPHTGLPNGRAEPLGLGPRPRSLCDSLDVKLWSPEPAADLPEWCVVLFKKLKFGVKTCPLAGNLPSQSEDFVVALDWGGGRGYLVASLFCG